MAAAPHDEPASRPAGEPAAVPAHDLAYARYCRHGRPEDLAAVFDATAPGLSLMAAHLGTDRTRAEDLVQTAFLQLIERGGPPPTAPILPWLLRVVANRARDLARRERRARRARREPGRESGRAAPGGAASPPPATLHEAVDPSPDPARHTEDKEAAAIVARAIGALPEDLRQVLVLNLLHGLQPLEIAHALGRPPATVRTWLRRGLQRLRGGLPRGIAITSALAAAATGEGRCVGLGAVRAQVLGAAQAKAAAAATAVTATAAVTAAATSASTTIGLTLAGGLVMKNTLISIGVLLGAALAFLAFGSFAAVPRPELQVPGRASARELASALPGDDVAAQGAAVRTSVPGSRRAAAPVAADASRTVRFHGRCVAAEDGRPLPDATVSAEVYEARLGTHTPMGRCTTDAAGRFVLPVKTAVDHPRNVYNLACWAPGRTPSYCSFQPVLLDDVARLGDVPVRTGREVRIRAEYDDGTPIAFVELRFLHSSRLPGPWGSGYPGVVTTDGEGRVALEHPVTIGSWNVEDWGHSVLKFADGGSFEVRAGVGAQQIEVVARRPDPATCIAGIVVDTRGAPVPALPLRISGADAIGYRQRASDLDGRFSLVRITDGPHDIVLDPADTWYRLTQPVEGLLPGTKGVRAVVEAMPRCDLTLVVQRAADGQPVEEFAHVLVPRHIPQHSAASVVAERIPAAKHHAGGRLPAGSLPTTPHLLYLYPEDPRLSHLVAVPVAVPDAPSAEFRIEVPQRRRLVVSVRDAGGRPVAGARVDLIQSHGEFRRLESLASLALDADDFAALRHRRAHCSTPIVRLLHGYTGADGTFAADGCPDAPHLFADVNKPLFSRGFVPLTVDPGGDRRTDVRLESRGGLAITLEGVPRILDLYGPKRPAGPYGWVEDKADDPELEIYLRDAEDRRPDDVPSRLVPDPHGRADYPALAPGRYTVHASVTGQHTRLGTVEVRRGATTRATFDLGPLAPARAAGVVRVTGGQLLSGRIVLGRHLTLGDDGSFRIDDLLPGAYQPSVQGRFLIDGAVGWKTFIIQEAVTVRPGATRQLEFDLDLLRVALEVVDRDGEPQPDRVLVVVRLGVDATEQARERVELDAAGHAVTTAERRTRLRIKTVVDGPDATSRLEPLGDFDLPAPGRRLRVVIPEHLRIQKGG